MNILFIANDPNLLHTESATFVRMHAYAEVVSGQYGGTLHIFLRALKTETSTHGPLVVHAIQVGRIRAFWKVARAARACILAEDIDVVSAQDPFEHGLIALRAVRGTQAKLHIQAHTDFLSPWFTRGFGKAALLNRVRVVIARAVLVRAQGIRVVSERIKESIIEMFGTRVPDISVLPIGVSHADVSPTPFPSNHFTYTLVTVGRLEVEKRIQDLIQVVATLKPVFPGLGLYVIGDGRKRHEWEQEVRARKISDQVVFLGARPDARSLMQSADAYIQASAYEGYGLTLIEAALAGIPIITTDVGIVGSVLAPQEHAYVAPVADVDALVACVRQCIESPEQASAMASRAREHVMAYTGAVDSSLHAIIKDMATLV